MMRLKTNPKYKCAAPMKLYAVSRVETIERFPEFLKAKEKASTRSCTAKIRAFEEAARLMEEVKRIEVTVRVLDQQAVVQKAIDAYNRHQKDLVLDGRFDDAGYASKNSDSAFLERITVNYIRHNLTAYDDLLDMPRGKVGKAEAQMEIQRRVYDAIGEAYPELAAECDRQFYRKEFERLEAEMNT